MVIDEIHSEIGGRLGLHIGQKLGDVVAHNHLGIVTQPPRVTVGG
jgi:DNA repair ATPase RecN